MRYQHFLSIIMLGVVIVWSAEARSMECRVPDKVSGLGVDYVVLFYDPEFSRSRSHGATYEDSLAFAEAVFSAELFDKYKEWVESGGVSSPDKQIVRLEPRTLCSNRNSIHEEYTMVYLQRFSLSQNLRSYVDLVDEIGVWNYSMDDLERVVDRARVPEVLEFVVFRTRDIRINIEKDSRVIQDSNEEFGVATIIDIEDHAE